jgi:hypothetical protein
MGVELGGIHGMAQTWGNLGSVLLETDRAEEGKPHLARAYRVLARMGSPHADTASRGLVQACGSVEAANKYLAKTAEEEER